MTEAEKAPVGERISAETHRVYYALKDFTGTLNKVRAAHIERVYREERFLHGEVPKNLDERIELGIRIVFLQVSGILTVTNLPRHLALRLIRNLVDMSIAEITAMESPSITDKNEVVLWEEVRSILDS
jgi:hypothetical protein